MVKQYTAEQLESRFKKVGIIRKMSKKFADDATYWEGGQCNWGGSHNLHEDCQTLANSFNKIDSLGNIKKELLDTTSKQEFEAKKENFLRKVQEAESGLKIRTGSASSMFGICIIWADEASNKHVERIVNEVKKELDKAKASLGKETYKWVEEIKQLDLEIGKIEAEVAKLRKEALDEKDPIRRAKIIEQIEDQGKVLQGKYQKKQELSNKFNFDPGKKVKNLIDAIKRALDKKDKKGSGNGGISRTPRNPNNSDSEDNSNDDENFNESDTDDDDDRSSNTTKKKRKVRKNFFQDNKQLIIIAGLALLVIIYLYSQNGEEENYSPRIPLAKPRKIIYED